MKLGKLSFFLSAALLTVSVSSAHAAVYATSRSCTPGESWSLSAPIPDEFRDEFKSFLSDQKVTAKALRGFSEAIALRKIAHTSTEKWFAEYWISRALYSLGFPHIAYSGFAAISARTPDSEAMPVHAAAVDCMIRIHMQHPSFPLSAKVLSTVSAELAGGVDEKVRPHVQVVAWAASVAALQVLLSDDKVAQKEVQPFLTNLRDAGAFENFGRALWTSKQNDHFKTIESLKHFFANKIPDGLTRYEDAAHLLLARAEYSVGQFDMASDEMKLVSRRSNDLADSLSELAWAFLMDERYPETIGTAMNLEAGGLRHTFMPEAPMVSAMAMNELCQYPDAVKEITIFRRNYEKSYHWLANWVATENEAADQALYEEALDFIRKKNQVPDRVGGEWIRSPLFIASQDEINTLFDERDAIPKVGPAAGASLRSMALEILQHARELKPKLKVAKMKLKSGEQLPGKIRDSLDLLHKQVVHWRRLQLAAPVWLAVSHRFQGTVGPTQKQLIARIDSDIKARNLKMLTQLDEISENIQLIEVEIYNGASQDIIWQNAHPDYKELAKHFSDDQKNANKGKVLDWGRALASSDENSEIWEDELGSFKANLFDNCSSKDKYLAIRLKHRSGT